MKRLSALAALAVIALITSGCSADEAMRFGWPEGITPEAHDMRVFWQWSVIAALAMGILVWGLIFWTITFHRRKKNGGPEEDFPRQTGYNVPLELAYTAIPFVLIAVMFYFTVIVQNKVEDRVEDPAIRINVTAFQWNWKFGYDNVRLDDEATGASLQVIKDGNVQKTDITAQTAEGAANPFGVQIQRYYEHDGHQVPLPGAAGGLDSEVRDYLEYDAIETLGTSSEIPVLVVPVDTVIEFNLASADVIHSFWVPEFTYKKDLMPFPKRNHQDPVFQISKIDRVGSWVGRCAEMCGTYHAMMNFEIRALSKQDFADYIEVRANNPQLTNAEALQEICQVPSSVTTLPFETRRVNNQASPDDIGDPSNTVIPNCVKGDDQ